MPRSSLPKRLSISLLVVLGVIALAEGTLRAINFRYPPAEFPILIWNPDEDRLMKKEDYLFEVDPHSLWRLRPGARVQFGEREAIDGAPEHVNAAGFRGPLRSKERTPGVMRIATLGDSSTFGVGVHYRDTYSAQLESLLVAKGVPCEVIDAGVEGYTIQQGLERYRNFVRPYRPDVVVAAFGAVNEHWGAIDFDDEGKKQFNVSRTQGFQGTLRWIRRETRIAQGVAWVIDPEAFKKAWQKGTERRNEQMGGVEEAGRLEYAGKRRVSIEDYTRLYGELEREVVADGGRLIVIAMPRRREADRDIPVLRRYTQATVQFALDRKLQCLYALGRFREIEKDGKPDPDIFIHDYWHPSATGHRLLAEWLVPLIEDPTVNVGSDETFPKR